jgi:hypothetical protein
MRLGAVAFLVLATLACRSASPPWATFRDPDCPVTFSYPTAWRAAVSRAHPPPTCEVSLYGTEAERREGPGPSEAAILIHLYIEPLETGARHGGFKRGDDGEWVQMRGASSPRGRAITTPHATGVEGWVLIRGSGREYPITVLGNAEWTVVINGEGSTAESADAFDRVVETLDVPPKAPN